MAANEKNSQAAFKYPDGIWGTVWLIIARKTKPCRTYRATLVMGVSIGGGPF